MKRFHVHVAVNDLESSIRFYSALFGADPPLRRRTSEVDDRRSSHQLRDLRARDTDGRQSSWTAGRLGRRARSAPCTGRAGESRYRNRKQRQLLLCTRKQVLVHRSARRCLGDVSHTGAGRVFWQPKTAQPKKSDAGARSGCGPADKQQTVGSEPQNLRAVVKRRDCGWKTGRSTCFFFALATPRGRSSAKRS